MKSRLNAGIASNLLKRLVKEHMELFLRL